MSKTCPKCGSDMKPNLAIWASRGVFHGSPKLTGYVCVGCRYVEFWQEGK